MLCARAADSMLRGICALRTRRIIDATRMLDSVRIHLGINDVQIEDTFDGIKDNVDGIKGFFDGIKGPCFRYMASLFVCVMKFA